MREWTTRTVACQHTGSNNVQGSGSHGEAAYRCLASQPSAPPAVVQAPGRQAQRRWESGYPLGAGNPLPRERARAMKHSGG
jgi:hypothetical protein